MGITKYDTDLMKRNEKLCGIFADSRLEIFTADLDFIKAATIKDFHHFVNRDQVFLFVLKIFLLNVCLCVFATEKLKANHFLRKQVNYLLSLLIK